RADPRFAPPARIPCCFNGSVTAQPIEVATTRMWPGSEIRVSPIAAGLTNQNFRVEVDGTPFFVRLPGASTELLAVDRANELDNTRAAAIAGVGPQVVAQDAESGAPARIAEALRRLHGGPRFRDDFDMVRLSAYYLDVVDGRAIRIPDGY